MAFTSAEKTRILFYLGYSLYEDSGPAWRAINGLDAREAAAGGIVRQLLEDINDVLVQHKKTIALSKAIEDGSIKLRAHYSLDHLRRLGRQYVNQLATFIKVSIESDIFSSGGAARDAASFYSGDPSR